MERKEKGKESPKSEVEMENASWEMGAGPGDPNSEVLTWRSQNQKVDRLPWLPVTEAELFAVCVSQKVVELYRGIRFQKPLELAFAKLSQSLDDEERYTLENRFAELLLEPLSRGCQCN